MLLALWWRKLPWGLPTLAIEMDVHMGWTNRVLSKLVDRVCLSYPDARLTGDKYVYTGRPLRPSLFAATREQGLVRFGLDPQRPVVLVFGGSLGAHSINQAVVEAFAGVALRSRSSTSPARGTTRGSPVFGPSRG